LADRRVSADLEQIMEARQVYQRKPSERGLPVVDGDNNYSMGVAAPIIAEGDVMGCVLFLTTEGSKPMGELEVKLAATASRFLGKQMET